MHWRAPREVPWQGPAAEPEATRRRSSRIPERLQWARTQEYITGASCICDTREKGVAAPSQVLRPAGSRHHGGSRDPKQRRTAAHAPGRKARACSAPSPPRGVQVACVCSGSFTSRGGSAGPRVRRRVGFRPASWARPGEWEPCARDPENGGLEEPIARKGHRHAGCRCLRLGRPGSGNRSESAPCTPRPQRSPGAPARLARSLEGIPGRRRGVRTVRAGTRVALCVAESLGGRGPGESAPAPWLLSDAWCRTAALGETGRPNQTVNTDTGAQGWGTPAAQRQCHQALGAPELSSTRPTRTVTF